MKRKKRQLSVNRRAYSRAKEKEKLPAIKKTTIAKSDPIDNKRLSPSDRKAILLLLMSNEYTQLEIADIYGVSSRTVNRINAEYADVMRNSPLTNEMTTLAETSLLSFVTLMSTDLGNALKLQGAQLKKVVKESIDPVTGELMDDLNFETLTLIDKVINTSIKLNTDIVKLGNGRIKDNRKIVNDDTQTELLIDRSNGGNGFDDETQRFLMQVQDSLTGNDEGDE